MSWLASLVDISITVSLVEVSPSTVIELKLFFVASISKLFKRAPSTFASVNMNDSMVPMFGSIIPDPFAIPRIFISLLSIKKFFNDNFGNVSVVMIASAASSHDDPLIESMQLNASIIGFVFKNSPITPVDETAISSFSQFSISAT